MDSTKFCTCEIRHWIKENFTDWYLDLPTPSVENVAPMWWYLELRLFRGIDVVMTEPFINMVVALTILHRTSGLYFSYVRTQWDADSSEEDYRTVLSRELSPDPEPTGNLDSKSPASITLRNQVIW